MMLINSSPALKGAGLSFVLPPTPDTPSSITPMGRHVRAFTIVELLVVITIMSILMAIILPSLGGAQSAAREALERKTIQDVAVAWRSWAGSHRNSCPLPGLIRRQMKDLDGDGTGDAFVPGSGRENAKFNDHASMLSLCIMENLLTPEQLVSPNEYSSFVYPLDTYRYNVLGSPDGADGQTHHWDPSFANDLLGNDVGYCNNSYAIIPLAGERRRDQWSRTGDSNHALISTRGPQDGDHTLLNPFDANGNEQEPSNTTYLMAKPGGWKGFIVFADGHAVTQENFYPEGSTFDMEGSNGETIVVPDNVFKADAAPTTAYNSSTAELLGPDIFLTHTMPSLWEPASNVHPNDVEFTPLHD